MPTKRCRDCREPFDQFTSLQNRCGKCTYKYNIGLANRSRSIKKGIVKRGKAGKKWTRAKKIWLTENPPIDGVYNCHYCGVPLTIEEDLLDMGVEILTLDHVEPRGSHTDKKYVQDNLVPCCLMDNGRKGSRSYQSYCAEFYPAMLDSPTSPHA